MKDEDKTKSQLIDELVQLRQRTAEFELDGRSRTLAEEALRKASRAVKMLIACNHTIVRAKDESALLNQICRVIVREGGYRLAWVGFTEWDVNKSVRPVAQAGFEEGYIEKLDITWADRERGRGPTGKAIRTGKPCVAKDILNDPSFAPWRAEAIKRGYASSIAIPLISNGQTFGALNIYAVEPDAFDREEARLLTELANDLSFGIIALRTRVERLRAEEELRKAHDELERRVQERTAELVRANEQLKSEIMDRKRLEKALAQKEKLETLGAIAAEVAHEIRNPLVSIGGFARRLKKKFPDLSECDIILSESQRLERILSRIRNYLKPVEMRPQECSVNSVVTDCVDLLSPEIKKRQVRCTLDLEPGLSSVHADPAILAEIFINLIRNAIEAITSGETLSIKTFENDKDLHIEFKNRATSASLEKSDLLFMPFAEGGDNIGLPFCYRVLKDMGGLLSVSQENDYIVFTVSLPKAVL